MIKVKFKSTDYFRRYQIAGFDTNRRFIDVLKRYSNDLCFSVNYKEYDFCNSHPIMADEVQINGQHLTDLDPWFDGTETLFLASSNTLGNELRLLEIMNKTFFKIKSKDCLTQYRQTYISNGEIARLIGTKPFEVRCYNVTQPIHVSQIYINDKPLADMTGLGPSRIAFTVGERDSYCIECDEDTITPDDGNIAEDVKIEIESSHKLNIQGYFDDDQLRELIEQLESLL
ncbi:hypothetical protein BI036_gp008 [Morganella phage vB_MmoM_MP1]|uniref:Uncharacterized protein n=1 Tax=Morganella phage vB_MmoM_MP1 TaxID=1852628 RepID=A0A192YA83_9CAUD|nr:hypothetical protein BI036_gp008 [Morganella phage vB_MmoM_MP1]ANM46457.1 hypothetical protein MP1_gp0008 [Morganella phage vB_MmoM_MP1]